MKLISVLNRVTYLYNFLGHTVDNTATLSLKSFNRFFIVFTLTISLLSFVGVSREVYYIMTTKDRNLPIEVLSALLSSSTSISTIIHAVICRSTLPKVRCHLLEIDRLIAKNQKTSVSYASLNRQFWWKFFIIMAFKSFHSILVTALIAAFPSHIIPINMLLVVFSALTILQSLFYVDAFLFVCNRFYAGIRYRTQTCAINSICYHKDEKTSLVKRLNTNRTIYGEIQLIKIVHFKMWIISCALTEYFGWSLICFFLENFIHVTYSIHFIFVFWSERFVTEGISRK